MLFIVGDTDTQYCCNLRPGHLLPVSAWLHEIHSAICQIKLELLSVMLFILACHYHQKLAIRSWCSQREGLDMVTYIG